MQKTKKVVMATLLMCIVMMSVGSVMAKYGNENGNENGDEYGIKDQLRDGSCKDVVADQQLDNGDQLRARDGSCTDPSCEPDEDKPYRDGSCNL